MIKSENTADYSQPDFYRFSEDSVQLAKFVAVNFNMKSNLHILDLCAGSGIVGIELANSINNDSIDHLDFCEYQSDFIPHIKTNIKQQLCHQMLDYNIISSSFKDLDGSYDLIVCNPPYFKDGSGKRSPDSPQRNRCRFFIDSDPKDLFDTTMKLLKCGGQAFFLLRTSEKWVQKELKYNEKLKIVGQVSGANIVSLLKE